jgi:hypothetical protein
MTISNRDKIIERIGKMRASADSVNSEAEAMVFATKAAQLMDAYEVSEADLAAAEADGRIVFNIVEKRTDGRMSSDSNGGGRYGRAAKQSRANSAVGGINALTHTKSVIWRDEQRSVSCMGDEPDVEFAIFLYNMIKDAMAREYENYKKTCSHGVGRTAKASFEIAMTNRISRRLFVLAREKKQERADAAAAGNRDAGDFSAAGQIADGGSIDPALVRAGESASRALTLVDTKREEVSSEFNKAHPRLGTSRGFSSRGTGGGAYSAGAAAGDRMGFNRPIGGSSTKTLAA